MYLVVGPRIGALGVILAPSGMHVAVEEVWTQLRCLPLHVTARVEDLLHVAGRPDGEPSGPECVEAFILSCRVLPLHRGKLETTCTHDQSVSLVKLIIKHRHIFQQENRKT